MNTKTNIRRFWMWVGILLLLDLAVITLWKRWYWFFPSREVSEVYTRYAGNEDFNVVRTSKSTTPSLSTSPSWKPKTTPPGSVLKTISTF